MKPDSLFQMAASCLLATALLSCQADKSKGNGIERIAIENAFEHPVELKASDCFSRVRYIPLETSDSCLIGDDPQLKVTRDYIIVMTAQEQCLLFDKQSGKFLRSIGHTGDAPGACRELYGWLNEASGRLHFPAIHYQTSAVYDLDNRFIGLQKEIPAPPAGSISPLEYDYLDEQTTLVHAYASETTPDRIVLIRDTTVVASFPTHGEPAGEHVPQLGISTGAFSIETEETGGHTAYIIVEDGKCSSVSLKEHGPFWHLDGQAFVKVHFNDTIYSVTAQGLQPVRLLDFGSYRWNMDDRYRLHKDNGLFPLCFMENKRILLFRFCQHLYHPKTRKAYNAIYDKESGVTRIARYNEGITDDLTHFLPLQPTVSNADGEFAQLLQPYEIHSWFEEHPQTDRLPAEVKRLQQLGEEDNPVVALMQ